MTIAVEIKNADTTRDVKVTTQDVSKDNGVRRVADTTRLTPGESRTFWVHQLRDLLVEEVNPTADG